MSAQTLYVTFLVLYALFCTSHLVRMVGFRKRRTREAMDFLEKRFGRGPNDEAIAERARITFVLFWFGLSGYAWMFVSIAIWSL